MKKLLIAISFVLAFSSVAMADMVKQVVTGTCPADIKTIYVFYNAGGNAPDDSIKVVDGHFQMTINQEKNTFVSLKHDYISIPFYVDGTPVTVNFNKSTVTGSELNNKLGDITNQLSVYITPLNALYKEYITLYKEENSTEADKKRIDEMEPQIEALNHKIDSIVSVVFTANKTNLVGAAYLSDMMYSLDYAELKEILSSDNVMTRHKLAEPAKKFLENLAKRAPGLQYTDITENDFEGKAHKLSEWVGKGNYVMLDFWASWCGPCRAEMPNVKANYERYHSKGFEVIGISFDSKLDQWKKSADELKLPWIQLSDLKGWKNIACSTYGIKMIPASILIDPHGKIVAVDLRGDMLGKKLKEIYGE